MTFCECYFVFYILQLAVLHFRYLTGNQLSGESSVEGYIDALKRGCRCVERAYAYFVSIEICIAVSSCSAMDSMKRNYFLVQTEFMLRLFLYI
jgi:hypothetical protein